MSATIKQINGIQIQSCMLGYRCRIYTGPNRSLVLGEFKTFAEAESFCKRDTRFIGPKKWDNIHELDETVIQNKEKAMKKNLDETTAFLARYKEKAVKNESDKLIDQQKTILFMAYDAAGIYKTEDDCLDEVCCIALNFLRSPDRIPEQLLTLNEKRTITRKIFERSSAILQDNCPIDIKE